MGHAWYANKERALELKEKLNLNIPFDNDTPVGAFGTMFWFRPKALEKLFAHPWKWTDYNAEPNHVDGGLAHVQERLICYVAQDAGYITEQVLSSHLASWNYAMMEYKLQKFRSLLPPNSFLTQINAVKNTNYLSVKGAVRQLDLAIKRSIQYRFPFLFKVLRPVYRMLPFRTKH